MIEKMDTTKVQQMAQELAAIKLVLIAVDIALTALINMLKIEAFIGLFGATAVAQYLQAIQPKVRDAATQAGNLSDFATQHRQAWIDAGKPG